MVLVGRQPTPSVQGSRLTMVLLVLIEFIALSCLVFSVAGQPQEQQQEGQNDQQSQVDVQATKSHQTVEAGKTQKNEGESQQKGAQLEANTQATRPPPRQGNSRGSGIGQSSTLVTTPSGEVPSQLGKLNRDLAAVNAGLAEEAAKQAIFAADLGGFRESLAELRKEIKVGYFVIAVVFAGTLLFGLVSLFLLRKMSIGNSDAIGAVSRDCEGSIDGLKRWVAESRPFGAEEVKKLKELVSWRDSELELNSQQEPNGNSDPLEQMKENQKEILGRLDELIGQLDEFKRDWDRRLVEGLKKSTTDNQLLEARLKELERKAVDCVNPGQDLTAAADLERNILGNAWKTFRTANPALLERVASLDDETWRLLTITLPQGLVGSPDLEKIASEGLVAIREMWQQIEKLRRVEEVLASEAHSAIDIFRLRETFSVLGNLSKTVRGYELSHFSLETWIRKVFREVADQILRRHQQLALGGDDRLLPAVQAVKKILGAADLEVVEIVLGRTLFDPGLHSARTTERNDRFPDGVILAVVANSFRDRRTGKASGPAEVIVNRL